MTSTFSKQWKTLSKSQIQVPSIRIFDEEPRDLFLGLLSKSPEVRTFFMLVDNTAITELPQLPLVQGFEITSKEDLYIYPGEKTRLEISLTDQGNSDIFDVLVEDIARTTNQSLNEPDAVTEFINRIVQWQKFVEKTKLNIMSEENQRGLFGELQCLRDLIGPQIGLTNALKSWTGPSGEVRDFEYSGIGVEVKTTISRRPRTFSVASELQLDDTHLNGVVVFHLSLQTNRSIGESLVEMIDSLRIATPDAMSKIIFEQRINEYGYSEDDREKYERRKYSVVEQIIYLIDDDFPRVIESDLNPGVSNVRYNVSIDLCEPFQIDKEKFSNLITGEDA